MGHINSYREAEITRKGGARMKRAELEKHLGNNVELTLLNGTVIQGELHKTGEKMFEHEANLYIPKKLLHLDKTTILYI